MYLRLLQYFVHCLGCHNIKQKVFFTFFPKISRATKECSKGAIFPPKYLEDYDLDKFPMETGFWRKQYSVDNAGII